MELNSHVYRSKRLFIEDEPVRKKIKHQHCQPDDNTGKESTVTSVTGSIPLDSCNGSAFNMDTIETEISSKKTKKKKRDNLTPVDSISADAEKSDEADAKHKKHKKKHKRRKEFTEEAVASRHNTKNSGSDTINAKKKKRKRKKKRKQ